MIHINCNGQGLIGDSLCTVPFLDHLCQKHQTTAFVTGHFANQVLPLIADHSLVFREPNQPITARYDVEIRPCWEASMRQGFPWHMAQMYFSYYGEPVPALPLDYPMISEDPHLAPGIVITPFSRSNNPDNNKFWPHERWREVIHAIRQKAGLPVYVVGAGQDDFTSYQDVPGVWPIIDRPLTQVLRMLQDATLVLGLDNGISHLCHFGGVDRHVMIYPHCLPPRLAENPRGAHVRRAWPANTSVADMLAEIHHGNLAP